MAKSSASSAGIRAAVIVAALGYFVDVYDLLLFSIVRVTSLRSIGVPENLLLEKGLFLLNAQMAGMLIGGIVWGMVGDKRGRLSVLFGSIAMYSLANIANGFVHSVELYGLLRLLAGIGLAGELGAGITLVAEIMPKESRGIGTTIVATVGVMGAIAAALVGDLFTWQTSYFIGGGMGLLLFAFRIAVSESGIYKKISERSHVRKGDLRLLLSDPKRLRRYRNCIFTGMPTWFVIGILVTFAPEFAKAFGSTGPVTAGRAVLFAYIGLVTGDFASGLLSQILKRRKRVIVYFMLFSLATILAYLYVPRGGSPDLLYAMCVPLGFGVGYWAVFVTTAAEQFGTNLRATVTTTVPNFVRGAVVPITATFQMLRAPLGIVNSALVVGLVCIAIALCALWGLKESYGTDLDFVEG